MKTKAGRICLIVFTVCALIGALFYPIAGKSLHATSDTSASVSPKSALTEFFPGDLLAQFFYCEYDTLDSLSLSVAAMASDESFSAVIKNSAGEVLASTTVHTREQTKLDTLQITFAPPISNTAKQTLTLELTSISNAVPEEQTLFFYGNAVDTGRFSIAVDVLPLSLNGVSFADPEGIPSGLCVEIVGTNLHWFGQYYWWIYGGVLLLLAGFLALSLQQLNNGKSNVVLGVAQSLSKYRFLIKQLVMRDFKTKYKRSVLGMLWSFLNPLLTMSIQYVVFSTLFRSDIPNFIIYLLTGIICYNFFNEATNMCLMSIIGNASLINKVYMPKYIYPLSRTISSGVNLMLSLIPLFLMLLLTRTPITPAILLLPFALLMLFMLSYGVGLILATLMVFFRDTQFLWSIASMLLMYLTPIFYPETIIPAQFLPIYKLNPLYHVLRFIRSILIDGVSLEPKAYLYCMVLCLVPFLLGILIFRKNQDKFVLNI